MHHVETEMRNHAPHFAHAFFVGGDLGLQVGNILFGIAAGILARGQKVVQRLLLQVTAIDHLEVVDDDPLLADVGGKRRHGTGRHAADIGVVAAARHIEQDGRIVVGEDRRHHGNVGQVGAAVVRRVEHVNVTRRHLRILLNDGFDRAVHRAQMHRHVRRVGDQLTALVENRAGEIEPLLDVDRIGRGSQASTPICSAIDMKRLLKTSSMTGIDRWSRSHGFRATASFGIRA